MERRHFLITAGAIGASAGLAGCGFFSTDPDSGDGGAVAGDDDREAPSLRDQVEAGELPPLEDRLPEEPMVVEPVEQVGRYGGTWQNALIGSSPTRLNYTLAYESLVRWNLGWDEVIPNVVQSYEANEDGTRYVFHLRPGMKWSDGEPFDADDIVFTYEHVLKDDRVGSDLPATYQAGGEDAELERIDDYTVAFQFSAPQGLFLEDIASSYANILTRMPRHYLERFHADFNDDADAEAEEAGYSGWEEMLEAASDMNGAFWQEPDVPRLHAWVPTGRLGEGQRLEFERNPYFWKTDPDGRQLPYLDGVVFDVVNDEDALLLQVMQGEIDLMDRHVNTVENRPVLHSEQEQGNYGFYDLVSDKVNSMTVMFNLTVEDEVKREIFNNRDFRIGLSHAINREELIATVHADQGVPQQVAPSENSEFYDEEMSTQYTEYDVELANQYLDEAGYSETNSNGIRLGPDGEPIQFQIDASTGAGKPELIDGLELVIGYWREVGVDASINGVDQTLFSERRSGNQQDADVWDGDGGIDILQNPQSFAPTAVNTGWSPLWAEWYSSGGSGGEEPPEAAKEQLELYDQVTETLDEAERADLIRRILEIAKEQFYTIGISSPVPGYGVVKNDFRNMVPETFFAATFPYPGVTNPEQFFKESD